MSVNIFILKCREDGCDNVRVDSGFCQEHFDTYSKINRLVRNNPIIIERNKFKRKLLISTIPAILVIAFVAFMVVIYYANQVPEELSNQVTMTPQEFIAKWDSGNDLNEKINFTIKDAYQLNEYHTGFSDGVGMDVFVRKDNGYVDSINIRNGSRGSDVSETFLLVCQSIFKILNPEMLTEDNFYTSLKKNFETSSTYKKISYSFTEIEGTRVFMVMSIY